MKATIIVPLWLTIATILTNFSYVYAAAGQKPDDPFNCKIEDKLKFCAANGCTMTCHDARKDHLRRANTFADGACSGPVPNICGGHHKGPQPKEGERSHTAPGK